MVLRENKLKYIAIELVHHLPFSIFGVTLGLITMGFLTFFTILLQKQSLLPQASEELFHIFHSVHILFSAVATTAMFIKHEKKIWKGILVGFCGSIAICGVSDIFFPYIGGLVLGQNMLFHICIIEEPGLIFLFTFTGILAGLAVNRSLEKSTEYSHSMHVYLSSIASILYLLSFGLEDWTQVLGEVFVITIFAVMIPCCVSDIAFPLACTHHNDE